MSTIRKPTRLQILWAERPDRRSLVRNGAIVLVALLVGAAIVLKAEYFKLSPRQAQSYGLGPGWDCTYPGRGEPVCVKHAPPPGPAAPR